MCTEILVISILNQLDMKQNYHVQKTGLILSLQYLWFLLTNFNNFFPQSEIISVHNWKKNYHLTLIVTMYVKQLATVKHMLLNYNICFILTSVLEL